MAKHNKLGTLGEEMAEKFLKKRGFVILDRNYRRPWGELDIVAENLGILHFIEVKSVSVDLSNNRSVSSETHYVLERDGYRAEDNIHQKKILRLKRIIQTYLYHKRVSDETSWVFDVVTVLIDEEKRRAKIDFIEDIILD